MKRITFTEEQIISDLREQEASLSAADLRRALGVSDATIYKWKAKFGGIDVSETKQRKGPEDQNARPKRLLADVILYYTAPGKSGHAFREAASGRPTCGRPQDERAAGESGHRLLSRVGAI